MTKTFGRLRAELDTVLTSERDALDHLIAHVVDTAVDPVALIGAAESHERFGRMRSRLVKELQEVASESRRREEERSTRQFVLRALETIGCPQNAGFLEEYVWASERVSLNTRGFGALRRDERRAWGRHPGHRLAYIVPCLDAEARPLAKWMARSDWPLHARIVVEGAGELFELKRVAWLLEAERRSDAGNGYDPFFPLIEKYGESILEWGEPTRVMERQRGAWLAELNQEVSARLAQLTLPVETAQSAAAETLEALSEDDKLWGHDLDHGRARAR